MSTRVTITPLSPTTITIDDEGIVHKHVDLIIPALPAKAIVIAALAPTLAYIIQKAVVNLHLVEGTENIWINDLGDIWIDDAGNYFAGVA